MAKAVHALARAGFTDDAERPAGCTAKETLSTARHHTVLGAKPHTQVLHPKVRLRRLGPIHDRPPSTRETSPKVELAPISGNRRWQGLPGCASASATAVRALWSLTGDCSTRTAVAEPRERRPQPARGEHDPRGGGDTGGQTSAKSGPGQAAAASPGNEPAALPRIPVQAPRMAELPLAGRTVHRGSAWANACTACSVVPASCLPCQR